jgi:hypothetical protein
MGIYDEFYAYGDYISGNLYTVFRGTITDFGLAGSLIFAFIVGSVCALNFWYLLGTKKSEFSIVFFIYFVAISYQTYIISTLTWLTISVVVAAQWIMLILLTRIRT